jgi:hypothetical protein
VQISNHELCVPFLAAVVGAGVVLDTVVGTGVVLGTAA